MRLYYPIYWGLSPWRIPTNKHFRDGKKGLFFMAQFVTKWDDSASFLMADLFNCQIDWSVI